MIALLYAVYSATYIRLSESVLCLSVSHRHKLSDNDQPPTSDQVECSSAENDGSTDSGNRGGNSRYDNGGSSYQGNVDGLVAVGVADLEGDATTRNVERRVEDLKGELGILGRALLGAAHDGKVVDRVGRSRRGDEQESDEGEDLGQHGCAAYLWSENYENLSRRSQH
jgi:hypothetical protein